MEMRVTFQSGDAQDIPGRIPYRSLKMSLRRSHNRMSSASSVRISDMLQNMAYYSRVVSNEESHGDSKYKKTHDHIYIFISNCARAVHAAYRPAGIEFVPHDVRHFCSFVCLWHIIRIIRLYAYGWSYTSLHLR